MSPTHHLPEELLLEYATGASTQAVALFVATHAALCPLCRGRIEALESVGAELLAEAPEAQLSEGAVDRMLAALDGPAPQAPAAPTPDGVFPRPLLDLVGPAADLPWKRVGPSVRRFELPMSQLGFPVRLYELGAGSRVPSHRHGGTERTLVLTGGYTDAFGHFGRGDVAVLEGGFDHNLRIDPGEPCISFGVNDRPLLPTTWIGELYQWWVRA